MHSGEFNAAKQIFEDLSNSDPKNDRYHYQLGMCYIGDDQLELARLELELCISLNKHNVEAYIELGDICFKLGDDSAALNYLSKGCEIDPDHPRAQTYLARMYQHMGDLSKAIEHYVLAVQGSKAAESPRHDLALALVQDAKYLEGYLILQELLDEADLGLLWSKINRTETEMTEINTGASQEYMSMLHREMEDVELRYEQQFGFSIHYTKGILDALELFLSMSEAEILQLRNEIRLLQTFGVTFDSHTRMFSIHCLGGKRSGFQLGCLLYVAEQLTHSDSSVSSAHYHAAFDQALVFFQDHQ